MTNILKLSVKCRYFHLTSSELKPEKLEYEPAMHREHVEVLTEPALCITCHQFYQFRCRNPLNSQVNPSHLVPHMQAHL